jgi:hypothetical protein
MLAGHRLGIIELLVTICTKRFKFRKVAVKVVAARALFAKPHYLHVHIFGVRQDSIIGFIKTGRIELTNKRRAIRVLF